MSYEPFDLPPTADVVFQYLFSSPGSENGLKCFINAINLSSGRKLIASASIKNPFNLADFDGGKKSIVDVKAQDDEGKLYDIEMQVLGQMEFPSRITYYLSQLYASQLHESECYEELRPAISIAITQFEMFPQLQNLHNVFMLKSEADPGVLFSRDLEIHTLELVNLKIQRMIEAAKLSPAVQKPLWSWMDYLLNANRKTEAEMDALIAETPGLAEVHNRYTHFNEDEMRRERALQREKARRDEASRLSYTARTSREEGRAEGLVEGRAEGLVEGRAEGVLTLIQRITKYAQRSYGLLFTEQDKENLHKITDLKLLGTISDSVVFGADYEEFRRMF